MTFFSSRQHLTLHVFSQIDHTRHSGHKIIPSDSYDLCDLYDSRDGDDLFELPDTCDLFDKRTKSLAQT